MNSDSPSCFQDFQCLFAQMAKRLEYLPPPRSVAELELAKADIDGIRQCFANLKIDPRAWLADRLPRSIEDNLRASPSEVIAGLLLILGAEVCRSEGTEGAVWPCVRRCLPSEFEAEVFPGGQPSTDLKDALYRVTRNLQLRSAIGWEDSLEYFNTLKLQFAFTRRGARRRLAEWLVGLGEPVAVQALRGADSGHSEVAAPGFRNLWRALKRYRAEHLGEDETRRILEDSSWIRGDWIDELLKQAKARREQLGAGEDAGSGPRPGQRDGVHFPARLALDWSRPEPSLSLELDEDEVESTVANWNVPRFQIAIDGAPSLTWLRQSGSWRGERRIQLQNWNAATMTISSMDGCDCAEFELGETGLSEDLLVFDLNDGGLLLTPARMKTTRPYALLCDDVLELAGADSDDQVRKSGRQLYRLHAGWPETLRLELGGLVYWQPRISEAKPVEPPDLVVCNFNPPGDSAPLGSEQPLVVRGVPEDALEVSLLLGKKAKETPTEYSEAGWRTSKSVQLDVPLLTGENRLRVRVRTEDRNRCWPVKTSWNILGLAVLEQDQESMKQPQWEIRKQEKPLNRASGRRRARVFAPAEGEPPQVFEGSRNVAQGQQPFNLSGLLARGDPLKTRDGSALAKSVEDHGCVMKFYPQMLGRDHCSVLLNDRIEPSDDHKIVLWLGVHSTEIVSVKKVRDKNARCSEWVLPPYGNPLAWAVAFRGKRIGSDWRCEELAKEIFRRPPVETFALLRWFKAPVLGPEMSSAFLDAVKERPERFVQGWIGDGGLPFRLKHTEVPEELSPAVRSALWKADPRYPSSADQILQLFVERIRVRNEDRSDETLRALAARRIAELCPPFAWRVLRRVKKGNKLARRAIRELLVLTGDSSLAEREAALNPLRQDSRRQLSCDSMRLNELTGVFLNHMKKGAVLSTEDDFLVRQLAETPRGAQYLAAVALLLVDGRDTSGLGTLAQ